MQRIRKIFISALMALLLVALIISAVFLRLINSSEKVYARSEDYYTIIGSQSDDLVKDGLDDNLLSQLFMALAGVNNYSSLLSIVNSDPDNALTSADFRTQQGGTKNVSVWFGGKKWDAVYLTKKRAGEALVLTLWQSADNNLISSAWATYGDYTTECDYPAGMYSTSKMRVEVLNNGGYEAINKNTLSDTVYTPKTSDDPEEDENYNTYARFTSAEAKGSVVDYLVQPKDMAYQETENAIETASNPHGYGDYTLVNDAYGLDPAQYVGTANFYSDGFAEYVEKDRYSDWKNDYVWLPSIAETGNKDDVDKKNGIWETNADLRSAPNSAWLRSCHVAWPHGVSLLNSYGEAGQLNVTYSNLVRPAIHLNLSATAKLKSPQDITVDYSGKENTIAIAAEKGLAEWYNSNAYSSGVEITYADADTKSPVQASDTKNAGKYTVTLKITDEKISWEDAKSDSDKTREITMTVKPAKITVEYDDKFSNENNYIYRAGSEKHKLYFPQDESGGAYNENYVKLSSVATAEDKQSVEVRYYYVTHTEDKHKEFIDGIDGELEKAKQKGNSTDAAQGWATYAEGKDSLEVSDPKGYCVFYKITADNHETLYGHFSVHIATEYLKVTTKAALGEFTFGETIAHIADEAALKDYVNDNVIQDITDNKGESRFEQLKKESHLFEFYLYKLNGSVHESVTLGNRLDAGDYYLGVRYTAENKEDFIHVLWNPSGEDDGEHPKLTIKPKEVEIEWATGVVDDEAEKAKVSDSALKDYADKLSWAFDDTEKTPTAKFTDVDGQEQTVTLSYGSGDRKHAGTFTATAQTVKNYTFKKDSQDFKILQAKNGWKTEFKCYNFSVGDTPKETGGEPLFGKAEKFYFTGDNFGTQFNDANWPAGEYRVKFTVGATPDYDGLDSSNEPDQSKYTFTVSECVHNFQGQPYQHNDSQHWQICKKCGAPGNYKDHTPQNGGELVQGETQHWLVCEVCKVEYSKANHVYKAGDIIKEAKCNEKGEQEYKCDCGAIDPEKHEIDMKPHTFEQDLQSSDSKKWYHTEGSTEHKHWHECTVCGERTDEAACHQIDIKAEDPTCTKDGHTSGAKCDICGKIITPTTVREKLGHTYNESDVQVTKPAKCEEAGKGTVQCEVCGDKFDVDVPATGHDYNEWQNKTPATCTVNGEDVHECQTCGKSETRVVPAAHKKEWESRVEPTEASVGYEAHYECEVCHKFLNDDGTEMDGKSISDITIAKLSSGVSSGASDWLKENWLWIVLAVAALLVILLIIFIILGIGRRRRERERERERLERERERDRQFETFMKMQMMSSYNMGGFGGGGQPDGAVALDGAQYALPPASHEVINVAVTAAIAALRADGTLNDPHAGNMGNTGGTNGYASGASYAGYSSPDAHVAYSQPEPPQQPADQPVQGAQGTPYAQPNGQPTAQQYSQPFITPEPPQPQQQAAQAQPQPSQPTQPSQPEFKDNDGFYDSYKKPKYVDDDDEDD